MKKYLIIAIVILSAIGLYFYLSKAFNEGMRKVELIRKLKDSSSFKITFTSLDSLKDGDIIFQQSLSAQSESIQLATHSVYSHCGILYRIDQELFVYEAIEPVKLTALTQWMGRGKGGSFKVKRLKGAAQILTADVLKKLKDVGNKYKGKHYDQYFEWTDEKMYCSELVWKIYKEATGIELGALQKLKDFDLSNDIVKNKLRERYGNKIPLDELVISPSAIFNSDKLITVL